jgi:DNA-binding IclR family transcriptional regulator
VVLATGQRQPLAPGAPVKAVLAALPSAEADQVLERLPLPADADRTLLEHEVERVRETGFAIAEDEFLDGVSGVAVPVLFEEGRPQATIGVAGPTARMAARFEEIGQLALELTSTLRPRPVLEVA